MHLKALFSLDMISMILIPELLFSGLCEPLTFSQLKAFFVYQFLSLARFDALEFHRPHDDAGSREVAAIAFTIW
jgi:hypothetical protein